MDLIDVYGSFMVPFLRKRQTLALSFSHHRRLKSLTIRSTSRRINNSSQLKLHLDALRMGLGDGEDLIKSNYDDSRLSEKRARRRRRRQEKAKMSF